MKRFSAHLLRFALGATLVCASALQAAPADLNTLLQQVQQAARELDYSGVFSYSNSAGVQTMRLVHVIDGKGERERLESLDGPERGDHYPRTVPKRSFPCIAYRGYR